MKSMIYKSTVIEKLVVLGFISFMMFAFLFNSMRVEAGSTIIWQPSQDKLEWVITTNKAEPNINYNIESGDRLPTLPRL